MKSPGKKGREPRGEKNCSALFLHQADNSVNTRGKTEAIKITCASLSPSNAWTEDNQISREVEKKLRRRGEEKFAQKGGKFTAKLSIMNPIEG